MLASNKTVDEMVEEIEISKDIIETYIKQLTDSMEKIKKNKRKKAEPAPKIPGLKDKMVTKTDSGKEGVAIMTAAASAHADATRNQSSMSKHAKGNIFRPLTGESE